MSCPRRAGQACPPDENGFLDLTVVPQSPFWATGQHRGSLLPGDEDSAIWPGPTAHIADGTQIPDFAPQPIQAIPDEGLVVLSSLNFSAYSGATAS